MRILIPLVVAFTLTGCGSDDPADDQSGEATTGGDTGMDGDTTTGGDTATDGDTSTGGDTATDGDTTTGGDTATDGDTTTGGDTATDGDTGATDGGGEPSSSREALDAASSIDRDAYATLITRIRNIESAERFTPENYTDAIAAGAQATRGQVEFARADFLALLEQQIVDGESPLDFLNITEGSFNRVHLCPDGGRLLASKDENDGSGSLVGSYRFEDCEIGEIFLDGDYGARRQDLSDELLTIGTSFSNLRIDGADGISTILQSAGITQTMRLADDGTGGDILSTETSLRARYSVGIPDTGIAEVNVSVITTELAASDESLTVTDVLPADSRSMRILTNALSVRDEVRATQSAVTSTNLAEAPESSDFEQGEIDFTLQPQTNRLTVQIANGDPATFDAFILEEDNSVVSFTESWDSGDYEFGSDERLPVLFTPQ